MLNATKGHKLNKILPAFDLPLLLILVMFSIHGLEKLAAEPFPQKNTRQKEKEEQLGQAKAQNEFWRKEYEKMAAEAASLERKVKESGDLYSSGVQSPVNLAALRENIQRLRQEVHRQKKELEDMDSKRKILEQEERHSRSLQAEAQKLREKHGQLEEQNRILAEENATVQRAPFQPAQRVIQVEGTPLMSSTKRRPVYVALVNGTVSPVQEPFYTRRHEVLELGKGRFATVDIASRRENGETLERAMARDSAFFRLVRNIHPDKEYVALLVDSSSFEAFRVLRDVLRKCQIPFGWEPLSSLTIKFSPSGQIIPEETEEKNR